MCIRVQYAPLESACALPFDSHHQVITLPDGLPVPVAFEIVRTVLSQLAIEQPLQGAVCWCGADVGPIPRIPQQIRREQVSHGA
jgi:hypothetical protein